MRMLLGRLLVIVVAGAVLLYAYSQVRPGAPLAKAASQNAAASPVAALDSSFGTGGLVRVSSEARAVAFGAAAQDGGLLVSGGSSIALLSSSGGVGELFGGIGSLPLPTASGREFALGGLTVDSRGRLLVLGSSLYPDAENASPTREGGTVAFRPAALRILRILPGGGLDSSFGQGGVVETDLGLPAPRATDGHRRLGSRPALSATGVTVDSQGRIVLTGDAVLRLGRSCERNSAAPGVISVGFVARLGEDGTPDLTFGEDGLVGGRHLQELPLGAEVIEEPVASPVGTITYRSSSIYRCARGESHIGIAQLTQTGRARGAFGEKGALVGRYTAITSGSRGSVVALAAVVRREDEKFTAQVMQVGADGKPTKSFGTGHGRATVKLSAGVGGVLDSLAVDEQGRILVGGTYGIGDGRSMILLRLSAAGRQQLNFGPRGRIATRVPGLTDFGTVFFDPQGRLVTVYQYKNTASARSGLVVARYLLRD